MNLSRRSFAKMLGLAPVAAALPAVALPEQAKAGRFVLYADKIEMGGEVYVYGDPAEGSIIEDMGTEIDPAYAANYQISVTSGDSSARIVMLADGSEGEIALI